jgi:hypothetical protein
VWPQVITAILVLVVVIFLFFFSWFPLLPQWLQDKMSFATGKIDEQAEQNAAEGQGEREEFNLGSHDEAAEDQVPQQHLNNTGAAFIISLHVLYT